MRLKENCLKRWLAPIVFVAGMALALIGFWWLWTGLDIVQVERGWSAVIGGATILSAGLVIAAIAAVLVRLGEIARALAAVRSPADAPASPQPLTTSVRPVPPPPGVPAPAAKHEPDSERQIVGRHVSGDSTYVMFSDGTVEAYTPDGVLHFASLDELRAYADERDAANPGRP